MIVLGAGFDFDINEEIRPKSSSIVLSHFPVGFEILRERAPSESIAWRFGHVPMVDEGCARLRAGRRGSVGIRDEQTGFV